MSPMTLIDARCLSLWTLRPQQSVTKALLTIVGALASLGADKSLRKRDSTGTECIPGIQFRRYLLTPSLRRPNVLDVGKPLTT
jgi:hypothetical protein